MMGLMGAVGSAAGGMVLGLWGFLALNALGALFVLAPLLGGWLLRPALDAAAVEPASAETSPS
jgi:hypothetical protein